MKFHVSKSVKEALEQKHPVLAFESTIITHGLPNPRNLEIALELEALAKERGVTPATIAVLEGTIHVGLEEEEIKALASSGDYCHKFSAYDLPLACGLGLTGSTTVAGTSFIASQVGLKVFATGGIGGVHKESHARMDISNDIKALSENPLVVVSSGAKCILDLESTVEALETFGIPTIGWKTQTFPAFYYSNSGLKLEHQVDTPEKVALVAKELRKSALLVLNPIPKESELPKDYIETLIEDAHEEAKKDGITGKALTPYLLDFMRTRSEGRTVEANCALIRSNTALACEIARAL